MVKIKVFSKLQHKIGSAQVEAHAGSNDNHRSRDRFVVPE